MDATGMGGVELGEVSSPAQEDPSTQLGIVESDRIEQMENDSVERKDLIENKETNDMTTENNTPNRDPTQINFTLLKEEFSLKSLWYDREWNDIGTTAVKNFLLGLLPTCSDLYSDIQLFFSYLFGAMYIKTVDTVNHEYINSTDCTLKYNTIINSWNGTEWMEDSITYTYNCFETDPIYAWVTYAFIFWVPGFFIFGLCIRSYEKRNRKQESMSDKKENPVPNEGLCKFLVFAILGNLFSLVVVPILFVFFVHLYPIALVLCKIISIFQRGEEFKKISSLMARFEGLFEAAPQLCVNVFIICSRGDRYPSKMQLFSLVTSAISFNLPQIEAFNMTKTERIKTEIPAPIGRKEETSEILKLLPLFLSTTLFRILSIAIVFILLKWFGIILYVAVFLLFLILLCISRTSLFYFLGYLTSCLTISNILGKTMEMRKIRYRQIHMTFWFIINTVILLSLLTIANSSENIELSSIGHTWNNIPIVANIAKLNILIVFTLLCGIISLVLFYIQVDQGNK